MPMLMDWMGRKGPETLMHDYPERRGVVPTEGAARPSPERE